MTTLIAGERGPNLGLNWLNPGDLNSSGFDIGYIWYTTWIDAPTSTFAHGDLRSLNLSNVVYEFYGSGFTYDANGIPTGGTLNRLVALDTGVTIFDLRDFSLPMADVVSLVTQAAQSGNNNAANNAFKSAVLSGADTFAGSGGPDVLSGYAGNDVIRGNGGDDTLIGAGGRDQIEGGAGTDTAMYWGSPGDYYFVRYGDTVAVLPKYLSSAAGTDGIDKLVGMEKIYFAQTHDLTSGPTRALSNLINEDFSPTEYLASYAGLAAGLGTSDPTVAFDHYIYTGFHEGRYSRKASFDGLEYIASYPGLMPIFGTDGNAGTTHYIAQGRLEGRSVSFDGLEYIASYPGLMPIFGTDADAGARHYIKSGYAEGRSVSFDGLEYIASYAGLMPIFGADSDAGSRHYIQSGYTEGRTVTFDGLEYIASNPGLIGAYELAGSGFPGEVAAREIGASHYIGSGHNEGRATDTFDAVQYLANYPALAAALGNDLELATMHYIQFGYNEGRTDHHG
jgi:Ca2+-binding RTX toxin-like protein